MTTAGDILISGAHPASRELADLMILLGEILTVCDDANVSHCLDLYRVPVEGLETGDWPYTDVGRLVYRAKYKHSKAAARELAEKLTIVINSHPALRRADAIAACPPSGSNRHFDSPGFWRSILAGHFGFQEVSLRRTRPVLEQKTIDSREERKRNQENSMDCGDNVADKRVLVVDDLYMDGETLGEAVRALRSRNASEVFALCAVKTTKGTQGGVDDLLPGAEDSEIPFI